MTTPDREALLPLGFTEWADRQGLKNDDRTIALAAWIAASPSPAEQKAGGWVSVRAEVKQSHQGHDVLLGSVLIGAFRVPSPRERTEVMAQKYANQVNAALEGGILAFGCKDEAGKRPRCSQWCGHDDCPKTAAAPAEGERCPDCGSPDECKPGCPSRLP